MAIPYGRQNITEEDIQAVIDVLKSDFLTQGPAINAFEEAFAKYIGVQYAVAVANGTAALHLSNLALGVKPGDKVITTPITFAASANATLYCGGHIDFVDIDPKTFLMDLDLLEEKLMSAPLGTYKGIVPVDFAGYPIDAERLRIIADKYKLWVLEDACHAPGGSFTDSHKIEQRCGNGIYADLSIFSFHPVKHIATGEGGMITTNSKALYEKLLLLRTHGITKNPDLLNENHGGWYYEMQELGFNYRLSDIQAALGISQLKHADKGLSRRREIAQNYNEAFKGTAIKTPKVLAGFEHAYHLYIIQVEKRKELYDYLREHQIFAQIHYIPCHLMPYYRDLGWKEGDMPNAENYYRNCLSLPMYPTLTDEEQKFVINTINTFYNV
jgi:UDP-4-amino-4,6-dideoxy-N-acetyl-beta-L-altrosamine transaminase